MDQPPMVLSKLDANSVLYRIVAGKAGRGGGFQMEGCPVSSWRFDSNAEDFYGASEQD